MVARRVRCRSSSRALPAGGQVERAVQPLTDSPQRHHGDLTRSKLDPKRQTVQSAQHLDEVADVVRRQLVPGSPSTRVLDERPYAGLPPQAVEVAHSARYRQGLEAYDVLAGHLQRDPRSGQHPHACGGSPDRYDQLTARLGLVLAVVKQQQQVSLGERGGDIGGTGRHRSCADRASRQQA